MLSPSQMLDTIRAAHAAHYRKFFDAVASGAKAAHYDTRLSRARRAAVSGHHCSVLEALTQADWARLAAAPHLIDVAYRHAAQLTA